jgi:dissimilatory sulfite reductase (desulfoviridin) alpha/beta subunit
MLLLLQLMAFVDGVRYADGRWNCSNCGVDIVGVLAKLVLVENAESAARTRCRLCAEWDFSPENKVVELEGQGGRKESWVLRKTLTLEDVMHLKRIIRRMVDDGYNFQAKVAGALDFGLVRC